MFKKVLNKIVDSLIAFSSLFACIMLIIVAYFSFIYLSNNMSTTDSINYKMFLAGLLIAISSGIMNFLEIFIKSYGKSMKLLFANKSNGGK